MILEITLFATSCRDGVENLFRIGALYWYLNKSGKKLYSFCLIGPPNILILMNVRV